MTPLITSPAPARSGRVAGLDLSEPRLRAVLHAVIALASAPHGFSVSELATKVRELRGLETQAYKPRQAAYDLKKLRGKQWVAAIGKSRRYQAAPLGLRTMTALLVLREKVFRPLVAGPDSQTCQHGPTARPRWMTCIAHCRPTCKTCSACSTFPSKRYERQLFVDVNVLRA
jgi:hypothetical protein